MYYRTVLLLYYGSTRKLRMADVFSSEVHVRKFSIVRPIVPPPDGEKVWLARRSNGCKQFPATSLLNATFFGGVVQLYVEQPGYYTLCALHDNRDPLMEIEAIVAPSSTFDCNTQFGILCPTMGTASLPPEDIRFAIAARLRLFVYTNLPDHLHSSLFERELPADVREGKVGVVTDA